MSKRKAEPMLCCLKCSYRTRFPSYLKRHLLTHEETRRMVCIECGSLFKSTSALNLHVREKHNSSAHVCQTCGLEFTHRRALDRHMLCQVRRVLCQVRRVLCQETMLSCVRYVLCQCFNWVNVSIEVSAWYVIIFACVFSNFQHQTSKILTLEVRVAFLECTGPVQGAPTNHQWRTTCRHFLFYAIAWLRDE